MPAPWPIYTSTSDGTPFEDILNAVQAGARFEVTSTSDRSDLVTAIGDAGLTPDVIYVHRTDATSGHENEYSIDGGTTWVTEATVGVSAPFAISTGTVSVSITASATGSASVSFPASRFTQAPIVQLTVAGDGYDATSASITSAGCTVNLRHVDGSSATLSRTVHWTAIQMTSASAAG